MVILKISEQHLVFQDLDPFGKCKFSFKILVRIILFFFFLVDVSKLQICISKKKYEKCTWQHRSSKIQTVTGQLLGNWSNLEDVAG